MPRRIRPAAAMKPIDLVVDTLESLLEERDEDEVVWGSMIKQAIKRRVERETGIEPATFSLGS
jgi:hypothetical protein